MIAAPSSRNARRELDVEPHQRCSGDADVEVSEVSSRDGGDAGEALPDDVKRVLGP